jgi:hypothetical protein
MGSISKIFFYQASDVDQELEYEVYKPCMK